jgi:hypothetical protein
MSQLASKFTPGPEPSASGQIGCGVLLLLLALITFSGSSDFAATAAVIGIVVIIAGILKDKAAWPEWQKKVKVYENGWICMQCGTWWLPAK